LAAHLSANWVQTTINYRTGSRFLRSTSDSVVVSFPNAHYGDQSGILSLPMFAETTPEQQRTVISVMRHDALDRAISKEYILFINILPGYRFELAGGTRWFPECFKESLGLYFRRIRSGLLPQDCLEAAMPRRRCIGPAKGYRNLAKNIAHGRRRIHWISPRGGTRPQEFQRTCFRALQQHELARLARFVAA
jgi:hypothetical protein